MAAPVDNALFDALMTMFFATCAVLGMRAALRPLAARESLAKLRDRSLVIAALFREYGDSPRYYAACGALTALAATIGAASCGAWFFRAMR